MSFAPESAAAAAIAAAAGGLLLEIRRGLESGTDPDQVRAEGDRRSHEFILAELESRFPADPVLSEEGKDGQERIGSRRAWIVDPLDGTREFGEAGRDDWAVHVALSVDGRPVAGAVALPARGDTLSTADPPAPRPRREGPLRLAVSRTRPPSLSLELARRLEGELVPMGSAGAKAMAVLRGEVDVYVHGGGQYEWDSAAPVAVALAAGLHATRVDGSQLLYNQSPPWLPDLVVCRSQVARAVMAALAELA